MQAFSLKDLYEIEEWRMRSLPLPAVDATHVFDAIAATKHQPQRGRMVGNDDFCDGGFEALRPQPH
jgi:hypothetical protein